jgi:hypothetical protein
VAYSVDAVAVEVKCAEINAPVVVIAEGSTAGGTTLMRGNISTKSTFDFVSAKCGSVRGNGIIAADVLIPATDVSWSRCPLYIHARFVNVK